MRGQILAAALAACGSSSFALAADIGTHTTIGGQTFFDFSNISLKNESASGAKVSASPSGTGFDVKRFYLVADHRFDEIWAADISAP
ncbi:MAG TPA: hypothetical protein VJQ47_14205 [Steroidobacteraceae bacterium]|nr:hypothetical protein [Steroidobacteraceae bacterium]